jgi:hypothetical protein
MPAGIPMALDPGRLRALQIAASQGDQQAIQILQQAQGGGMGGPPQGGPPPGGGGMPPMGPGGGAPPMQGAPGMSQAEFSGYGKPQNPDAKARQTMMLEQILRQRAAEMQQQGGGQPMQ